MGLARKSEGKDSAQNRVTEKQKKFGLHCVGLNLFSALFLIAYAVVSVYLAKLNNVNSTVACVNFQTSLTNLYCIHFLNLILISRYCIECLRKQKEAIRSIGHNVTANGLKPSNDNGPRFVIRYIVEFSVNATAIFVYVIATLYFILIDMPTPILLFTIITVIFSTLDGLSEIVEHMTNKVPQVVVLVKNEY